MHLPVTWENSARIGALFSIAGILLWVYSILITSVWWIDPKYNFGLFQVLPIWFWVGFSLNIVGIFLTVSSKNESIFIVQLLFLGFMVWGTPNLVEANARVIDSWQLLGTAKTIIDSGSITVTGQITHFYLQYPLSFTFLAEAVEVTGIQAELFLRIFPLLSSSIFIFCFYIFIRSKVPKGIYIRSVMLAFVFLDVWLSFHFCPQSFALMLLPLILICLEKQGRRWSTMGLTLFVFIVLFHPTLPAMILGILITTYILLRLLKQRVTFGLKLAFFGLVWAGWFVFTASDVVAQNISNAFSRFDQFYLYGFQVTSQVSRASGDMSSTIRLLTIVFILSFAAIIVVLQRKDRRYFAQSAGWFIGCLIFFVLDLSAFSGSFGNRSLMIISLIVPAIVVSQIVKIKRIEKFKTMFVIAFVLLLLPNLFTLYYAENFFIISDSNLVVSSFLNRHSDVTIPFRLVAGGLSPLYFYNTSANWNYWFGGLNVSSNSLHKNEILVYNAYVLSAKTLPSAVESMTELYATCTQTLGVNQIYNNDKFAVFYVEEVK